MRGLDDSFGNVKKAGLPCPGDSKTCLRGVYAGLELRVARLDDLSVNAAPGEPGELLVRGPMVIQDYYQALAERDVGLGTL